MSALAAQESERAYGRLQHAYAQPLELVRLAKRDGATVLGFIGHGAPRELAMAAGVLPLQLRAESNHATPRADAYMPDNHGWEARSLCQRLLEGAYDMLDGVVLTRAYGPLYHVLKEVHRQGLAPGLPDLFLFDLVPSEREAFAAYNLRCVDDFTAWLERRTGSRVTEAGWSAVVSSAGRRRELLRELAALRRRGALSGATALQLIGAAHGMHAVAYEAALRAVRSELQPDPQWASRPQVAVVAAEPLHHTALHACLEAAGMLVVAEDDAWGSRAGELEFSAAMPWREALVQQLTRIACVPHPVSLQQRERWLQEQQRAGALDAVVFYVPPSDRSLGWDYPALATGLQRSGVPTLCVRDSVLIPQDRERALAGARAFRDTLSARAQGGRA